MRHEPVPLTRQLGVYDHRGHTVLEFRGEIDIAAAAEIGPFLDRVTGRPGARVVIDLRPVEFFDCSGLRLPPCCTGRACGCWNAAGSCTWCAPTR